MKDLSQGGRAFTETNDHDTHSSMFDKKLWTVHDLMDFTGLARQTIYNHICAGDLPYRKKCGRLYFFPDEIINWIDEGELE